MIIGQGVFQGVGYISKQINIIAEQSNANSSSRSQLLLEEFSEYSLIWSSYAEAM
jgi:hypothetical protein